jgi:hypothetical protein
LLGGKTPRRNVLRKNAEDEAAGREKVEDQATGRKEAEEKCPKRKKAEDEVAGRKEAEEKCPKRKKAEDEAAGDRTTLAPFCVQPFSTPRRIVVEVVMVDRA